MKTTVIHHSADYDGIFCREIARKFLPDAELIGWDFADEPLEIPHVDTLYILDLPCDRPFGFTWDRELHSHRFVPNLVWIDHHASSIASHPAGIPGYRIDGVAACRLAWQWFTHQPLDTMKLSDGSTMLCLPNKQDYLDRKVSEPLAVRLAGEYDIWDKHDSRADVLQFGLRSRELTEFDWAQMFSTQKPTMEEIEGMIQAGYQNILEPDGTCAPAVVHGLLKDGAILHRYQQRNDASIMRRSFVQEWEGLKFLCLNTARCNSLTFAALDIPDTDHDALMGFCFNGKKWTVSLYHAQHRKEIDLSQIAVKYGGGGHRGACGFTCDKLPFIP